MGTNAKLLMILVLFAVFGLLVAFMCVMVEGSLLEIRRHFIILVWGYGGDIVERLSAIMSAGLAGIRSLFTLDEEAQEALDY